MAQWTAGPRAHQNREKKNPRRKYILLLWWKHLPTWLAASTFRLERIVACKPATVTELDEVVESRMIIDLCDTLIITQSTYYVNGWYRCDFEVSEHFRYGKSISVTHVYPDRISGLLRPSNRNNTSLRFDRWTSSAKAPKFGPIRIENGCQEITRLGKLLAKIYCKRTQNERKKHKHCS